MSFQQLLPTLISGSAGLLGAFIGAGAAILAGYLSDRRKQSQEDKHRDHDQRREAYLRLLSACDQVNEGERGKAVFIELKRSGQNIKLVAPSKEVSETAEKLVLLLAPDTVNDGLPVMRDPKSYDALLQEFYDAARQDLGKPPLR